MEYFWFSNNIVTRLTTLTSWNSRPESLGEQKDILAGGHHSTIIMQADNVDDVFDHSDFEELELYESLKVIRMILIVYY